MGLKDPITHHRLVTLEAEEQMHLNLLITLSLGAKAETMLVWSFFYITCAFLGLSLNYVLTVL